MARLKTRKRILPKKIQMILLILGILNICYQAPRSYALTIAKSKVIDFTRNIDIQNGDFIFQHLPGPLTEMIADVTQSQYSHCGIVVAKGDKFLVLEAIGPVRWTPINEWISRGVGHRFTIVRLKDPYQRYIPQVIQAAKKYLGRPYDIQYEWGDKKIYCSELIQKAVQVAASIPLADFVRLGDLAWQPYAKTIRRITGGHLPLDRAMITPGDVVNSKYVFTVYSSFAAWPVSGTQFSLREFCGGWSGQYFLVNIPLTMKVEAGHRGEIRSGFLASGLTLDPMGIEGFNPQTGEFAYRLLSENNIHITIKGRMDKSKEILFGKWHDSLGFSGTFLLQKKVSS